MAIPENPFARPTFLKSLLPCAVLLTSPVHAEPLTPDSGKDSPSPSEMESLEKLKAEIAERKAGLDLALVQLQAARDRLREQEDKIISLNTGIASRKMEIANLTSARSSTNAPGAAQPATETAASAEKVLLPNNFVADVTPYVVVIEGDNGVGTGFLCVSEGKVWVYTAAHVLSGNSKITVRDSMGRTYQEFDFLECAEGVDLVRLKPKNEDLRGLELTSPREAPKAGDVIVAIGNSLGTGSLSGESGRVTNIEDDMWEVDAEIIPGNSGGPVLSLESKKVTGIVTHLIIKRPAGKEALSKKPEIQRFAARLDKKWEWRQMPVSRFVKEWKYIEKMNRDTSVAWASAHLMHVRSGGNSGDRSLSHIAEKIITEERGHFQVQRMDAWIKEYRNTTKLNRGKHIDKGNAIIKQFLVDIRLNGTEPASGDFSWYHRQLYESEKEWRIKMTD